MNDINQDNLIFRLFPSFTHPYVILMRLDRPIGFLLLFYPVSFSLISIGDLNINIIKYLILFFIGSVIMRSAGCIFNDIFDKDIDKKVSRTKFRPIASSKVSIKHACLLLFILLIIGFYILLNLNFESIILGICIFPLLVLYPLAKRYFFFPQLILAITYNWGCFIGWTTINSPYSFYTILILYLSLTLWTIIYDTVYATQDEKDDIQMNLYSSSILFGSNKLYILNILLILQYLLLILFGKQIGYNFIFYLIILIIFTLNLLDINFKWSNKSENSISYFKRNNYYGFLILLSIIIGNQFNV